MSAEWFAKLKEFDSLEKMKLGHLKAIKEQEDRLAKLEERRKTQQDEVTVLKAEHAALQQSYFETEKKMNSCEEQASRLTDIGGDQEKILKFRAEAADLENSLFTMLERTEEILKEIEEKKTFLSGLEKTYLEIKTETGLEIEEHQKGLAQASLRQKLIEDELPPDFKNTLERTLKRNLAVGPFTRIENGSCFFCRYKISRVDESEIDMQKILKVCPQCMRIFLPYGS